MSYTRRNVIDGVTIMNKDLYDNLQDGIDENKIGYDSETKFLTIGLVSERIIDDGDDGEYDEADIISPDDAKDIFDEIIGN